MKETHNLVKAGQGWAEVASPRRLFRGFAAAAGLLLLCSGGTQAQGVLHAKDYSGFLEGDGYAWKPEFGPYTGHAGVASGCPQQGFDFTGLPGRDHTPPHWTNVPARRTACGWIVPQECTGFAHVPAGQEGEERVRVVLRSFHTNLAPPNDWLWWEGTLPAFDDNAIHQNDGWFHFQVRRPPGDAVQPYRLRFEVDFDNQFAPFPPGSPLQLNYWWWSAFCWDWEEYDGAHIFRPIYRVWPEGGHAGPWRRMQGVRPLAGYEYGGRHYRCTFEEFIPASRWAKIEVAQNLPYTLEDRDSFVRFLRERARSTASDCCVRVKHLGFGGLAALPGGGANPDYEENELLAVELFRSRPDSPCEPDPPTGRIVVLIAGVDYEPAGNFVAEGFLLELVDHWAAFRDFASYCVVPIANPDGYEWGTCHVMPYGAGYGDNAIHRGYLFLEREEEVPDAVLDPEALALRAYLRELRDNGISGGGGEIQVLLNLESDICPHPARWQQEPPAWNMYPPIYGGFYYDGDAERNSAVALIRYLRNEGASPYTHLYIRDPAPGADGDEKGWWTVRWPRRYGVPLMITFEFDGAALYAETPRPPSWLDGNFPEPIAVPGDEDIDHFYVHGYIEQVSVTLDGGGDPAALFKHFGGEIAWAVRETLLSSPFRRGDANNDLAVDIADAICALGYLFGGAGDPCRESVPECFDAADANDDGAVDIGDPIRILGYLFAAGGVLPEPWGDCRPDPTHDTLGCAIYRVCP